MLDALERKQTLQSDMEANVKALRDAKKKLPHGTLESYITEIKAKVETFEEERKYGGLTDKEIKEAEALMIQTGELESKAVQQSRRAYIKELRKVIEAADVII